MPERTAPNVQTFHVICAECKEDRWPYLRERPSRYVCVRCSAETPATLASRRQKGARMLATKRRRRSGASGPNAPGQGPDAAA